MLFKVIAAIVAVIAAVHLFEGVTFIIACALEDRGIRKEPDKIRENMKRWQRYIDATDEEMELFREVYRQECGMKAITGAAVIGLIIILWPSLP